MVITPPLRLRLEEVVGGVFMVFETEPGAQKGKADVAFEQGGVPGFLEALRLQYDGPSGPGLEANGALHETHGVFDPTTLEASFAQALAEVGHQEASQSQIRLALELSLGRPIQK